MFALIDAVVELIKTSLFIYYFAAISLAFAFTLFSCFIRKVGKDGS